jgi:hypothetical protein
LTVRPINWLSFPQSRVRATDPIRSLDGNFTIKLGNS